jgi:hypothetical protein
MGLSDFRTGSSGDADTVAARRKPVESPLTLIMTMRSPEDFEVLNGHIHEIQSAPRNKNSMRPLATASTAATATLLAIFPDATPARQAWGFQFGVTLAEGGQKISYCIKGTVRSEHQFDHDRIPRHPAVLYRRTQLAGAGG